MKYLLTIIFVQIAMIATAYWEAYSEGRNSWGKGKLGWKKMILGYELTAYHFNLFFIMFPALLAIPLIIDGWSIELFGVLLSAYTLGLAVEDFFWYIVNPEVKFREFFTEFSDYYPWIRIGKTKIIPTFYVVALAASVLSWYFLWR
jgi:hypothetical protein